LYMGCVNDKNYKENAANVPAKGSPNKPSKKPAENNNGGMRHTRRYNNFLNSAPSIYVEPSSTPSTPSTPSMQIEPIFPEIIDIHQKNTQNLFRRAFYEQEKTALRVKLTHNQELKLYKKTEQCYELACRSFPTESIEPINQPKPPTCNQPKAQRPILGSQLKARKLKAHRTTVCKPTEDVVLPNSTPSSEVNLLDGIMSPETFRPSSDNLMLISDWCENHHGFNVDKKVEKPIHH
jgi:hypothetical protein